MGKEDNTVQKPAAAAQAPIRLEVTLIHTGFNRYAVRTADNKPVLCQCGRPLEASLHNVPVDKRLDPCSLAAAKI